MKHALGLSWLIEALRGLVPVRVDPRLSDRASDGRWSSRYHMLDAWRGFAAIGILLHHTQGIDFGLPTGRVLVFFAISGYCIAASAESCMRRGMSAIEFFVRRIHRIYPPYILALLFFVFTRLVRWGVTGENQLNRPLGDWVRNLTLTQWTALVAAPMRNPFDNPALFVPAYWSLCYEEQFYLIVSLMVGLCAIVRGLRIWMMVLGLLAISLSSGALVQTLCRGVFIEFWTSFGLGMLVYYRLCVFKHRASRLGVDLLFLAIFAVSMLALRMDARVEWMERTKWQEWTVIAPFCLLLVLSRPLDVLLSNSWVMRPFRALGKITYSLFLVHQFNTGPMNKLTDLLLPNAIGPHHWFFITVSILCHIALALVFWMFCERPFLNRNPPGANKGERASASPPPLSATTAENTQTPSIVRTA